MKTFFFVILSFISVMVFSEDKGTILSYQVTKSSPSKTLTKSEASFVFTFLDPDGKPITTQIRYSYNNINKKELPNANGQLTLNVKPGKYVFQFFYNTNCNEIYTDTIAIKPTYVTEIKVNFIDANTIMDKPVIYVYPKQKEQVSIKLALNGEFTFTYPQYSNGWNFTANPDGTIQMAEKIYHYLFWDGKVNIETNTLNFNEGFIVDKNNLVNFFEENLKLMGLNSQEIEDYITYWCPRMQVNETNYIHFMFNEEYNKCASITIDPKPDQLFRVCMLWSKADIKNQSSIKAQKIETFQRHGFTVVEWGGSEMNRLPILLN